MTTVVAHPADVTAPCTSNGGNVSTNAPPAAVFRSSPFLDSKPIGPPPNASAPGPIGPVNAVFANVNNNGRPPVSNVQTPPYHNHFRQQDSNGPQVVAVRGKTDPAMAPYICAKCNKKIVDRYLLEALEKYWHEDCLKVHNHIFPILRFLRA